MTKNKFSIITVTLNNISGLKRTYTSLRAQSCRDFEWIVIDGNSDDGTDTLLQTLGAQWISEKDGGIYDAMNKGIKRSRGKYILFLNAGDALTAPDTLEMIATLTDQNPALIYGDSYEDKNYKPARSHEQIVLGLFTHHQAIFYNRKKLGELRYNTNFKIAADYDFTARALQQNGAAAALFCPIPVCIFESGGLSQQNAARGRNEQFIVRKNLKLYGALKNAGIYCAQTLLWQFRTIAPNLYWRLKSSGNTARAPAQNLILPYRRENPV